MSTQITYTADATGSAELPISTKFEERGYSLLDAGGRAVGGFDNSAALAIFIAEVNIQGVGYIPAGTYEFTTPPPAIAKSFVNITGDGPSSRLLYNGPDLTATENILSAVGPHEGLTLRGFSIESANTLNGGYGLRVISYQSVEIDIWVGNEYNSSGWNIFNGLFLESCTVINLYSSHFYGRNKSIIWTNGVELHLMNSFIKGMTPDNITGSGIGIHVGGGCGGLYSENVTQLLNHIGLLIDTSITGTGNNQFFLDSGTFDSNRDAHVYVNDSISNPGGKMLSLNGWFCTSPAGNGIVIAAWADGRVFSASGKMKNHFGNGIAILDSTAVITLGSAVDISDNQGYGIDASVPVTITSHASPRNNSSGAYGPNVSIINDGYGTQRPHLNPAAGWLVDARNVALEVANGSSAALFPGSGLVAVCDPTNHSTAIYVVGGGGAYLSGTPSNGIWVEGASPAIGYASVAYNGTAYALFNNTGAIQIFNICPLVMMNAAS